MKALKICHIINNDKFVADAIEHFNTFEKLDNTVFCLEDNDYKFLKDIEKNIFSKSDLSNSQFLDLFSKYDYIIFHNLIQSEKKLLLEKINNKNIVWIGWGHDYYQLLGDKYIYGEITSSHLNKIYSNNLFVRFLKSLIKKNEPETSLKNINKVKFFAPVLPQEFNIITKQINQFSPIYLMWNYHVNYFLQDIDNIERNEITQILVGNNAAASNNHLDSLVEISKLKDNNFFLSFPMSYSGDNKYIDYIDKYAKSKHDGRYKILSEFLDLARYNTLLTEMDVAIFSSLRQQGVGTINALLCNGTKVFLDERNPCFEFYNSINVKVFSVKELSQSNSLIFERRELAIHNRKGILSYFSKEKSYEKTENFIEILLSDKSSS